MNRLPKTLYMSLLRNHGKLRIRFSRIGILYNMKFGDVYYSLQLEDDDPKLYTFLTQYHIIKDSK
jgi:hypothetical protein